MFRRLLLLLGLAALIVVAGLSLYDYHANHTPREIRSLTELLLRDLQHTGTVDFSMNVVENAVKATLEPPGRLRLSADGELALASLEKQAPGALPPEAAAAMAVAYMVRDEVGKALALLEPALRRAPESIDVADTLILAYYHRGAPGDRVRAFDHAAAALTIHPASERLLLNAAFVGEALLPRHESMAAWLRYLAIEPDDVKRQAVHERLNKLSGQRAFSTSSDLARSYLMDVGLPSWAMACVTSSADESQQRAHILALSLQTVFGFDRSSIDFARDFAFPDESCDKEAAQALLEYTNARALYRRDRLQEASPILRQVERSTNGNRPALALQARLLAATAEYFGSQPQVGHQEFDEVARRAGLLQHFELQGRAEWMRGYVCDDQADYECAVHAYEKALEAFQNANSADGIASAHSLVASALDWLGQYESAWRRRELALAHLARMTDSRARDTILTGAIRAASRDGLRHAALRFALAKLEEPSVRASTTRRAQALTELADLQMKGSYEGAALSTLEEVEATLQDIGSAAARARIEARLVSIRAEHDQDAQRAMNLLGQALALYRSSGTDVTVARLRLARARAALRAGMIDEAENDLRTGIAFVERARRGLARPEFRLSYLDDVWDLFDQLLEITVSRGKLRDALEIATRVRGRELLDTLGGRDADVATSPRTSVAVYLALRERLVIGVFDQTGLSTIVQKVERGRLTAAVREFALCATTAQSAASCDPKVLSDLLINPVLDRLGSVTALTIIPDPVLQTLPFAMLRNSTTGRLLVEDVTLSFAPSLRARHPDSRKHSKTKSALIVGEPHAVDSPAPLPRAAEEARAVAFLYGRATLLTGSEASKSAFLEALPAADVIHFAGHAVTDPDVPDLSRLLLAPGTERSGSLYAHEIERRHLVRSPVVILAACDTAIGRTHRSEGMVSLSRAFMRAGARHVIGTLWRIDDSTSQALFVSLHRHLQRSASPAHALQRAQLDMLGSIDSRLRAPANWASAVHWAPVVN